MNSLAHRLLVGQILVIVAMAVAVVVMAAAIGPGMFDQHLRLAGDGGQPETIAHAEEAFRSAGLTSLAWGLAVAVLGATIASLYATRRIGAALQALADGSVRVSRGDYATPIEMPEVGRELTAVATSFATMADRLATVEANRRRMLTDLSHELRTPVAAIDILLEGVEDGVVPLSPDTIAALRQQTARLARLAGDMGDVSAAEDGRLQLSVEEVELVDLVATAQAAAAAGFAADGIEFGVGELPAVRVQVDPERIGQVLDNLLRNARQHTAAGGRVDLTVAVADGQLLLRVRDTGRGIGAHELSHIFERFYRGAAARHDEGAGTGVGLAISRAIAVAHGGSLTATSAGAGTGAEFLLRLPLG